MPVNIDNAFVRSFENTLRFLAQQSRNKLRGTVIERNQTGEDHVFQTLAPVEMSEKTQRRVATPEVDADWQNRIVNTKTFDVGDTVEKEDKVKMVIDPLNALTQNFSLAARRKFDDIIIDAAEANALDKDGGVNAFPAAQKLASDGTKEMSFDILTQIQEAFGKNDIDPDVEKFAVVGPTQIRCLMHDPKATSRDYVAFQAIMNGTMPEQYMGFRWIVSNRLNSNGAGKISCLFYTRAAMALKVDEDISAEIAKDPSKSFMWRVYSRLTAGAVRVEDKQIILFDTKNTYTAPA